MTNNPLSKEEQIKQLKNTISSLSLAHSMIPVTDKTKEKKMAILEEIATAGAELNALTDSSDKKDKNNDINNSADNNYIDRQQQLKNELSALSFRLAVVPNIEVAQETRDVIIGDIATVGTEYTNLVNKMCNIIISNADNVIDNKIGKKLTTFAPPGVNPELKNENNNERNM